jgi:hypothetical protein
MGLARLRPGLPVQEQTGSRHQHFESLEGPRQFLRNDTTGPQSLLADSSKVGCYFSWAH